MFEVALKENFQQVGHSDASLFLHPIINLLQLGADFLFNCDNGTKLYSLINLPCAPSIATVYCLLISYHNAN